MKRVLDFILHTNIYAAILIAALCASTIWIDQSLVLDDSLFLFVVSSSLFVYPFHRLYGAFRMDEDHRLERHRYMLKHAGFAIPLIVLSGMMAAFYFLLLEQQTQLYILVLSIITIAYTLPVIPSRRGWVPLRSVPGIKIFVIGVVMALMTVDLFVKDELPPLDRWLFVVERFLLIIALTIPFDIRDVQLDRSEKVKTIPTVLGVEMAKKWCLVVLSIFGTITFLHYMFGEHLSLSGLLVNWVTQVAAAIAIRNTDENSSSRYFSLVVEGIILLYAGLLLGASVWW